MEIEIQYVDLGGGLGITYDQEEPPHPKEYGRDILQGIRQNPLHPDTGTRAGLLVGNAGILVTKVLYVKKGEEKNFIIVDAGMNDLLRPSLYGAYHHIQPVVRSRRSIIQADVVGPICESGDFLGKDRKLAQPKERRAPGRHECRGLRVFHVQQL